MVQDKPRIAVVGTQTADAESANPYTVYRTVVTYAGDCYERMLRYSEFHRFYKKLKLRKPGPVEFPAKKWTRKASLEDDVIEQRQVLLNHFMKTVCAKPLTSQSEMQLMKLLKIGSYDDGSGRVSELSSFKASFIDKSDRAKLDVVEEEDDDATAKADRRKSSVELSHAATLASTSVAVPMITSNATTVLADDERSAISSRGRLGSDDELVSSEDIPDSTAEYAAPAATSNGNPRAAPRKSASSIPPSTYAGLMLNRPELKVSQSLPGRRSKRVGFSAEPAIEPPVSAPVEPSSSAEEEPAETEAPPVAAMDGELLSPEKKYQDRISSQLNAINRLLSKSDTDSDSESARSQPPLSLTA